MDATGAPAHQLDDRTPVSVDLRPPEGVDSDQLRQALAGSGVRVRGLSSRQRLIAYAISAVLGGGGLGGGYTAVRAYVEADIQDEQWRAEMDEFKEQASKEHKTMRRVMVDLLVLQTEVADHSRAVVEAEQAGAPIPAPPPALEAAKARAKRIEAQVETFDDEDTAELIEQLSNDKAAG